MMIQSRHVIAAFLLVALAGIVWPGDPFAADGSGVQESGKGGTRAGAARPAAVPQPPGEPDDDDEASYREALTRRSLQENCLICHTEDMIAGQRLTPVQWKAEIEKMVNWGAPLPKDAETSLIDYLSRRYSDRTAPPVPARAKLTEAGSLEVPGPGRDANPVEGDLEHGARAYAANCATCHGPSALGGDLGPSLAGKAILAHPREYERILRQGLRRMPGFQSVLTPRDQGDVLAWLRRQKYPLAIESGGR
jgi:mono/diheme cytochrome c family protein